jgi:hypothetical protein
MSLQDSSEKANYPGESDLTSQDRSSMWLQALADIPKDIINAPASLILVLWNGFLRHHDSGKREQ